MLITRSLTFSYDHRATFQFPDISLEAGTDLLILGKSGIGKTTLLHLMAGLLSPGTGHVELMGTELQTLSPAKLDRFRGRHIGLVFQRPHFIRSLSLQENLALVQYLAGKRQDKARSQQVLESLDIAHKRYDRPHLLSQGEQQRATIAMAVLNNPQLILADEPTSSLDDTNCLNVASLLKQQAATTGAQLVVITHDHRLKAHFQNSILL
ncbi:MAG: ATP-binding cassette domain-containing protein [Cytophagales bacterium]|nr:ATP-binding cassette domain-containing protein [Cytophagales bacterium]